VIADFHKRGVRVLFPMMMWDQATRQAAKPWTEEIAELMKELGADGINGDTQDGVPLAFSLAADKTGHPLAFEPEGSPSDEALAECNDLGQYQYPFTPLVDRYKWLEPRQWSTFRSLESQQDQQSAVSRFSTELVGRVGKISGASGMESRPVMGSHAPRSKSRARQ